MNTYHDFKQMMHATLLWVVDHIAYLVGLTISFSPLVSESIHFMFSLLTAACSFIVVFFLKRLFNKWFPDKESKK